MATQPANEESKLKHYVLAGTWHKAIGSRRRRPDVVGRHQDHSEGNVHGCLELLDDGTALVRLLSEDYRLETESFQQPGCGIPRRSIVTMDDEDPALGTRVRSAGFRHLISFPA